MHRNHKSINWLLLQQGLIISSYSGSDAMAPSMETKLGSSLPVPSVQELAKKSPNKVPSKYVRPDLQPSIASKAALHQVPVIDMQKLSADHLDLELEKLHQACREWGFFQLINHGANKSSMENMKRELQGLFNLPMEEKKKLWQKPGNMEGFGQHFVRSEDQKLDWADLFFLNILPIHMRKPHPFSALPTCFREAVEDYSAELRDLAMRILEQMARALCMD